MSKVFLDTNILVYSVDGNEPAKRDRARSLIRDLCDESRAALSTQVLQEFYVVATTKLTIPSAAARVMLQAFAQFEVVIIDPALIHEAANFSHLHQLSFWDALIVASAARANCGSLWTEDLNAGQSIGGVRVENPLAQDV